MTRTADELILTQDRDGVAVVTLNNPRRRNAITLPMVEQLVATLDQIEDGGACAVILTGAGVDFCSGADLGHLSKAAAGDAIAVEALRSVYAAFARLRACSLPTIAAVNGSAIGAGMNMALACDVRIAAESATFSTRFLEIGLHPGGGHTWMLREAVGAQAANAMVVFLEDLDGREAERAGLVWRCVADDDLLPTAVEMGARAGLGPRHVSARAKDSIRLMRNVSGYAQAVDVEIERQLWSAQQPEFQERIAARMAPRPAQT